MHLLRRCPGGRFPRCSRRAKFPKYFFGNFARAFFSECSGPAPPPPCQTSPLPPSRIHSSGGAQKNRGENFAARSFGFVAQAQVAGGGIFRPPPPPPPNSGGIRAEFGGEIRARNKWTELLFCTLIPSAIRPPPAPSAPRRRQQRPPHSRPSRAPLCAVRRPQPRAVHSPVHFSPPPLGGGAVGGKRRRRARCDIPRRLRGRAAVAEQVRRGGENAFRMFPGALRVWRQPPCSRGQW